MPDQTFPDLDALRAGIDRLDDALHDLLMQRSALVARMAAGRVKQGAPSFRPGREALILRRLLARNDGTLARPALVRLWREIISASLRQQGPFTVAAQEGPAAQAARGHFGLLTPLGLHASASGALSSMASGEAAVAVLPAPMEGEAPGAAWWAHMDVPRLRVVAALPFLSPAGAGGPSAYAVAPVAPEPTGRDRSLLRLTPAPEHSRECLRDILSAAGLRPLWLLRHEGPDPVALAAVEGFLAEEDPRLGALPFPRMQILGAHAEPEPEE